jgi:hypothetical protein
MQTAVGSVDQITVVDSGTAPIAITSIDPPPAKLGSQRAVKGTYNQSVGDTVVCQLYKVTNTNKKMVTHAVGPQINATASGGNWNATVPLPTPDSFGIQAVLSQSGTKKGAASKRIK